METTNRLAIIIKDLRRSLLSLGLTLFLGSLGYYTISATLLAVIQDHLHQQLAFFTVAGPFLAHVKISVAMALFTFMPWLIYCLWRALAKPFKLSAANIFWFVLFTCLLFYSGAAFCYFVTLPYGVDFLLGFQTEQLKAVISIDQFVTFVAVFILAFGLIFELPVFMIFLAKTTLLSRGTFAKNRRYALLVISIVASLLTPTPDIVNMLLMGVPLYMLYELGIIALKMLRIP
ncbi:twin-arginine translocase subunit TatC [Thiovibrio sp. JS02]